MCYYKDNVAEESSNTYGLEDNENAMKKDKTRILFLHWQIADSRSWLKMRKGNKKYCIISV